MASSITEPAPTVAIDATSIATPAAVPVAAPVIEADDNFADADSTFGSEAGSSLNYGSITSSIYNYRLENGRTYHAYSDGKYALPNDEQEQDRLDMVYHSVMLMLEGKPFYAPVKKPQRIVDQGCGTGIWCLDVGDQYPEAHVIGIDLSPIQPKWTAPNVEFRIDDFEKPWVFDKPLDLVHSRLCAGIAIKNWPNYFAEAYKSLRPGGWVEVQECDLAILSDDGSMDDANNSIIKWSRLCGEGLKIAGGDGSPSSAGLKQLMEDAGFINVGVVDLKWPIGPWPKDTRLKEAGAMALRAIVGNLSGLTMAVFTRLLGWERIEVELFVAEVKKEFIQRGNHGYWPLMVVYGQKPESKKTEDEIEVEVGPAAPVTASAA